jgi:RNA polymerase sigma factor (sigma-70 family)
LTPEQQERAASAVGLVYTVMEHLRVPQAWHDEAESDGMLGLVHAARSFVPGKIGWGAFAYLCIERRLKNTLQRLRNYEKRRDGEAVAEVVIPAPEVVGGTQTRVPPRYRAFGELAEAVYALPTRIRQALWLIFVAGRNLRQASRKLDCSKEQVRHLVKAGLFTLWPVVSGYVSPGVGHPVSPGVGPGGCRPTSGPSREWTSREDAALRRVLRSPSHGHRRLASTLLAWRWNRPLACLQQRMDYLKEESTRGER